MTKLKLKNILSELLKEVGETHPVHKKINDKLMQIAKRGSDAEDAEEDEITGYSLEREPNTPEDQSSLLTRIYHNKKSGKYYIKQIGDGEGDNVFGNALKESEEKEYTVDYWYRYGKDGDDKEMDDIKVKASSESEAIEKAKQGARKGAISSSFEIRKAK
jgi:hypothetical protein